MNPGLQFANSFGVKPQTIQLTLLVCPSEFGVKPQTIQLTLLVCPSEFGVKPQTIQLTLLVCPSEFGVKPQTIHLTLLVRPSEFAHSNVAISSEALAVAVPTLPTTIPAAWFASDAASIIVAPDANAAASVAMTVSPAPVTS
jgi:hypothetical protein